MTYIADLDPNHPANLSREAASEQWDAEFPNWREQSVEPEDRTLIAESDVAPETDEDGLSRALDAEAFGGFHNP